VEWGLNSLTWCCGIPAAFGAAMYWLVVIHWIRNRHGPVDDWPYPRCVRGCCGRGDFVRVAHQFEGAFFPASGRSEDDSLVQEARRCPSVPEGQARIVVCRCGDLYAGTLRPFTLEPGMFRRVGKDGTLHPFMMRPRFRFTWIPDVTSSPILKNQRPL
jgi:hypothetical protein